MKRPESLTEDEHIKLCEIFHVSDDLRIAYGLKLAFRQIFKIYGKEQIAKHIFDWLEMVKDTALAEFNNFFRFFPQWFEQLVNAFLLPYSNGYTEGCNNKIKVLKRISYGVRNFERFRTSAARQYSNYNYKLPSKDSNGKPITYNEFDVNNYKGPKRDAERLVRGSDGSVYYTDNHFDSFIRID